MPFELARHDSRLPRWNRLCLQALAATLDAGLALAVFALVAAGEAELRPFGQNCRGLSLTCFAALNVLTAVPGNRAYDAYRTWDETRLPSAGEFFRNHELTRLVGQGIGITVRGCEPKLPNADSSNVHRLAEREGGCPRGDPPLRKRLGGGTATRSAAGWHCDHRISYQSRRFAQELREDELSCREDV